MEIDRPWMICDPLPCGWVIEFYLWWVGLGYAEIKCTAKALKAYLYWDELTGIEPCSLLRMMDVI